MDRLAYLRSTIDRADQIYYNSGNNFVSDAEYDALKKELKQLQPSDDRLKRVGAPVPATEILNKVQHSRPMGSLDNAMDVDEFNKWHASCSNCTIMASLKLDGSSLALYYENGKLKSAISRGDGKEGLDLTANAVKFGGVLTELPKQMTCAVRGEVLLTKEQWKQIDPKQESNSRNLGNGIMQRKNGNQSELLTFVAFDIANGDSICSEEDKMLLLNDLGFDVVSHELCNNTAKATEYHQEVSELREDLSFAIDGVVFAVNDHAQQRGLGEHSGRPKYGVSKANTY